MPLPVKRKNHAKTRMGRSHEALKKVVGTECPNCQAVIEPHKACTQCGMYRGRKVFTSKADVKIKRAEKHHAKDQKEKEKLAKLKNK